MTRPLRASCAPRSLRLEPLEDRRLLAATDLELLFDVRAGMQSSSPAWLTPVGNTLFFTADNNGSNVELWKTDGSTAGTSMVKEIRTQTSVGSSPLQLTNFGGVLYFQADGGTGRELYKSDGTALGTVLVKEINPSGSGFAGANLSIEPFAVMGSAFYFRANDGTNGPQIWRSDGTPDGTTRVSNINPGPGCDPSDLTVVGSTLYFRATDGTGYEVWKTDGTTTSRLKDINTTGTGNANPVWLTAVGSTLYFQADDGTSGAELWKSNGTEGGTVRVKDIRTNGSSFPSQFTPVGGTLYFSAIQSGSDRELWKSDGSEGGTVRVKDINIGLNPSTPTSLTNFGGTLYFGAFDGTTNELYKSNGTDAGTVPVTSNHLPTTPDDLAVVGGTLYFAAATPGAGLEVWKTDGTAPGTAIVEDLEPGVAGAAPTQIVTFNGRVYVVATTSRTGTEIWREAPKSYGDYDQDRDADGADYLRWQRSVGSMDFATDVDRSGVVNATDLTPWRNSFGTGGATELTPPEPAASATHGAGTEFASASPFGTEPDMFAAAALAGDEGSEPLDSLPQATGGDARDAALAAWTPPAPAAARAAETVLVADDDEPDEAPVEWLDFDAESL